MAEDKKPELGREMGYVDKDGNVDDTAFYEELLDNPEADRKLSVMAIERAVKRGVPREEAERIWGLPDDVVNASSSS